jgi:hypothetical protein
LANDPAEKVDVAAKHPAIVKQLQAIMDAQHVASSEFPMRLLDHGTKK